MFKNVALVALGFGIAHAIPLSRAFMAGVYIGISRSISEFEDEQIAREMSNMN